MTSTHNYARTGKAVQAGQAIESFVESGLAEGLDDAQAAASAWWRANGDLEHKHTQGVYLKQATKPNIPPTLIVYIDSASILQDFTTNHELYEMRLAYVGFKVKEVVFKLSSYRVKKQTLLREDEGEKTPLPDLTEVELAHVAQETEQLAEPLKSHAREAMISSLKREKASKAK